MLLLLEEVRGKEKQKERYFEGWEEKEKGAQAMNHPAG